VLELVLLYLGGSLALLFNGPGRFSFDAGIVPALLDDLSAENDSDPVAASPTDAQLVPVSVELNLSNQA
jgi:putative oxidoreductase